MTVRARIVQLGRSVYHGEWPEAPTLAQALAEVGLSAAGLDVRINGRPALPDQMLCDGDLVTIVPLIKGGIGRLLPRHLSWRERFVQVSAR